ELLLLLPPHHPHRRLAHPQRHPRPAPQMPHVHRRLRSDVHRPGHFYSLRRSLAHGFARPLRHHTRLLSFAPRLALFQTEIKPGAFPYPTDSRYHPSHRSTADFPGHSMITRIWHGWTNPENANAYESLLRNEIFPSIERRQIPGYRGISLLRT